MIYFIRDTLSGLVKIGYASDPWRRLAKIQSDNAGKLHLVAIEPGGVARERELHASFKGLRERGEWFRSDFRLETYIASLPPAIRPTKYQKTRPFWNGRSAAEVARACDVSSAHVAEIQSGKRRPGPALAMRLQRFTGRSALELVFGADAAEVAEGYDRRAADKAA